jgi:hypothetical protein
VRLAGNGQRATTWARWLIWLAAALLALTSLISWNAAAFIGASALLIGNAAIGGLPRDTSSSRREPSHRGRDVDPDP